MSEFQWQEIAKWHHISFGFPIARIGEEIITFNKHAKELGLDPGHNVIVHIDKVHRAIGLKITDRFAGAYVLQKAWAGNKKGTARLNCPRIQRELPEFIGGIYRVDLAKGLYIISERVGDGKTRVPAPNPTPA